MSYTVVANSIMGADSFGLLINLHLQDWFPVDQAIMYYNYIAIFTIVVWALFAGQSNESRYAFTTPLIAALMVFIGWLRAPDASSYWGMILLCLVLGAFMYLNDMNHEKYGIAGPGDKLFAIAFMIMCFTGAMGFVSSAELGLFPSDSQSGTSQNVMCGTAYTCDSAGNVALDVSVTSISSSGGLGGDIISTIAALPNIAWSIIKLIVVIVGSVLFFGPVMMAAYPALASSPQVVAFLLVMNVVIWAVYAMAMYRMFSGRISGGDI